MNLNLCKSFVPKAKQKQTRKPHITNPSKFNCEILKQTRQNKFTANINEKNIKKCSSSENMLLSLGTDALQNFENLISGSLSNHYGTVDLQKSGLIQENKNELLPKSQDIKAWRKEMKLYYTLFHSLETYR